MQIAAQTISWGPSGKCLLAALSSISGFGVRAVELSQSPWRLLEPEVVSSPERLELVANYLDQQLSNYGCKLLGLAGGSLPTRIALCHHLKNRPSYLYIDSWEPGFEEHLDQGIPLAFHPHVFKPFSSTQEIRALLLRYPKLRFLPDTAHLFLVHANSLELMTEFQDRIAAIHLKDWDNRHGWSRVMYARGFTELGMGNIREMERLREWIKTHYSGYCVIEQDSTDTSPESSLACSLKWIDADLPHPHVRATPVCRSPQVPGTWPGLLPRLIHASRCNLHRVYDLALEGFKSLTQAPCISLWEVNNQTQTMTRESTVANSDISVPPDDLLPLANTIAGEAVQEQALVVKTLAPENLPAHLRVSLLDFLRKNKLSKIYSIPIPNIYNPHTIDFVVNVFLNSPQDVDTEALLGFSEAVGAIFDSKLNELHADVVDQFAASASECEHVDEFLLREAPDLFASLDVDSIYFFSVVGHGGRLLLKSHYQLSGQDRFTGQLVDPARADGYRHDIVGIAFESRCARSTFSRQDPLGRNYQKEQPIIAVPLYGAGVFGVPKGVLVCVGRRPHGQGKPFAMHDEIILDAVQAGFGVQLERTADAERRADSMRLVRHEMGNPLGCIANAIVEYEKEKKDHESEVKQKLKDYRKVFGGTAATDLPDGLLFFRSSRPLLRDIEEWLLTADAVLQGRGFLTARGNVEITPQPVKLLYQIIKPAANQVLKDVSIENLEDAVSFGNLSSLPILMVDKAGFTQVMLNLIRNAVKYRKSNGRLPDISFAVRHAEDAWEIDISDQGIGVEAGYERRIFEKGVRTPRAMAASAVGDGFGLWLVAKILSAHGCSIRLSQNEGPTVFSIRIPKSLELKVKI